MAVRCINKNLSEFTDIADALGSAIQANSLIVRWQDANKTDALPTVKEALDFNKSTMANHNLKTKEFAESLYGNLTRLGIISKYHGSYYIVSSRNRVFDPSIRDFNLRRLYSYLRVNNIPKESIVTMQKGKGLAMEIKDNVFTPRDILPATRGFDTPHSREVVRHLMRMFPQVSITMLSVSKAKILYDSLPDSQKANVPFDQVNSFYVDGQAVLIKGRVTDDVAIEEMLHPFIDSVYVENQELFNNLLEESRKNFPELRQEINDAYSDKRGFTQKHRDLELVTQALSRHFNKEYKQNETKSFKDAVKQFLDWFMEIIQNLSEYLTGKPLGARSISAKANLTDIAKLLNTSDIQFKLEKVADRKVRYNLTGTAKIAYDNAVGSANAVQKQIIETLFHAAVHSPENIGDLAATTLEDGAPILVLDEATHTYQDLNNLTRPWMSTTTAIKGKMSKEQEEKSKLNLELGNDFDNLLNALSAGLSVEDVVNEMKILDDKQARDAYNDLSDQLEILKTTPQGKAIALPQVVVYDDATGIAGTIDLLLIEPNGTLRIVDLKTSKNGLKDYSGYTQRTLKYDKQWDLSEESQIRQKLGVTTLSIRQQHNTQVNVYRRMLQNMGYTISTNDNATSTIHIKVDVKGEGKKQEFKGTFKVEESREHPIDQNQEYVDAIVPSNVNENRKSKIDEAMDGSPESYDHSFKLNNLTKEEQVPDDSVIQDPEFAIITQALKTYQLGLIKKNDAIDQLNKQVYLGRHKTTADLQEQILNSISAINVALSSAPQARSRIYSSLLRDALAQMREFKTYVEDPKNFGKPEYITYVLNFNNFLGTFQGLYTLQDSSELNGTQKSLVLNLQTEANGLVGVGNFDNYKEGIIDRAIQDYVRTVVKDKSKKDMTDDELDRMMKIGEEIGIMDLGTRDMSTQRDTLLAIMDKIYKAKKQELLDKIQTREDSIKRTALKLQKLAPEKDAQKMFDFMLVFDENGEFTGRYVQKIGRVYYDKLNELRDKLYDAAGNPLQFKDITDASTASVEDLEWNIKLAKMKKDFSNFFRAETIGLNEQPIDGKYHYYTKEFKDARAKYEYFVAAGDHGYWRRKDNISDREWDRYQAKYFTSGIEVETRTIAKRVDGEFTGEVIHDFGKPFVRNEYRKIRDDVKIDGKDIKSDKYNAIMNDTSALGMARKEFYLMFKELFEEDLLKKLPKSTRDKMIGRVPVIRGRITQDLKAKPSVVTKMFAKTTRGIKNLFRQTGQNRTMFANEDGELVDSLPIFYTGSTRTDSQLEAIDLEIEALKQDRADGKIKIEPYRIKLKELEGTRAQLENKPTKEELNRDMGNALLKFAGMAEHYETMGTIEDTMKAFLYQLEKRQYTTPEGSVKKGVRTVLGFQEKASIKGSDSRVLTRAKKWMNMVYYDNDQITKGFWEKVSDGLIQLSSLSYVAFNPFGNFNNYVLGRVNDNIEAIGGRFFSGGSYARASLEYNKRAMPDLIHRLSSSVSKIGKLKQGDYDPEKATSKYEAFVELYRMMDDASDIRESGSAIDRAGKSLWKRFLDFGYVMQDAAEWNVQTKVGMAMIIDTRIRNDETGEILSLYDAFDFDGNTKELKLKEGFKTIVKVDPKNVDEDGNSKVLKEIGEYNDDFRYQLRNEIREVNKQIHGNYAYEDRMVIQSHTLGKLAAQFHKWIAPAYRARFEREYFDENLGWMEGRYKSWGKFVWYASKQLAKGNMAFNKYASGFLDDYGYLKDGDEQDNQRALNKLQGFYRTTGEIGITMLTLVILELMKTLWRDGDEEDNEILKRFQNIAMYQADRTFKELILFWPVAGSTQQMQMVKSPIASTRTMGELGEALWGSIETPFYFLTQDENEIKGNSSVYYQRGSRKGSLKLKKQWQDVVPIWYSIKKWQNYLEMNNFFIK
jgi:hypothetical protein